MKLKKWSQGVQDMVMKISDYQQKGLGRIERNTDLLVILVFNFLAFFLYSLSRSSISFCFSGLFDSISLICFDENASCKEKRSNKLRDLMYIERSSSKPKT